MHSVNSAQSELQLKQVPIVFNLEESPSGITIRLKSGYSKVFAADGQVDMTLTDSGLDLDFVSKSDTLKKANRRSITPSNKSPFIRIQFKSTTDFIKNFRAANLPMVDYVAIESADGLKLSLIREIQFEDGIFMSKLLEIDKFKYEARFTNLLLASMPGMIAGVRIYTCREGDDVVFSTKNEWPDLDPMTRNLTITNNVNARCVLKPSDSYEWILEGVKEGHYKAFVKGERVTIRLADVIEPAVKTKKQIRIAEAEAKINAVDGGEAKVEIESTSIAPVEIDASKLSVSEAVNDAKDDEADHSAKIENITIQATAVEAIAEEEIVLAAEVAHEKTPAQEVHVVVDVIESKETLDEVESLSNGEAYRDISGNLQYPRFSKELSEKISAFSIISGIPVDDWIVGLLTREVDAARLRILQ